MTAEAIGVAKNGMTHEEAGLAAAAAVDSQCLELGLLRTLRDVEVPEEGLELIAATRLHDRGLSANPKHIADAGLTAHVGSALRCVTLPEPFVPGELAIHYEDRRVAVAGYDIELIATGHELLRTLSLKARRVVCL